ncbi:DUF1800 domain-containing protein [Sphingomonas sp. LB-2]|uniref:DUF1800 domain-containing protein n=1 Tax=Sphingomonas caeni TaxID=2984949 RepID=UPI0022329C85|nr:DUF1800 domain-containing protein [Sphingomonas caeni]MCW3847661.1 DUF1800 domain-containing protein [Sphingomonas caeni]
MSEEVEAGNPEPEADTAAEPVPPLASGASMLAMLPALALAACDAGGGGGGGGGIVTPGPSPAPVPTPTPTIAVTRVQASRFLAQASFGATKADIEDVITRGYDGWITNQFGLTRATTHWNWLSLKGYRDAQYMNDERGFDNTMWRQIISDTNQLRQRVGMALLEMLVVGIAGVQLNYVQFAMAAYADVLLDNAFDNFRTIIEKITFNAAMASYLTFLGNRKANMATGAVPDENYARELMQLFTMGLYRLNMDGSLVLSGGNPVETYTQADVSGLARIFTGLTFSSFDFTTPDHYEQPLVFNDQHETGASSFLGVTVPSGTSAANSLKTALDTIFNHANVPPFVSKQLIQRLVTSNPSAAYINRVANVFANNGSGVRGDMKAVVRAILMDAEARADPLASATSSGKLREPVMRLTGWARAFGATSPSDTWQIGDTSSSSTRLAESMGRSQSVFNFFRPGYSPPNTAISAAGLTAPEFQITNELSVVAYINFMAVVISNGIGDFRANYTTMQALAADSQALVDEINILLAAGQLTSATVASIKAAVDSVAFGDGSNRVYTAILLTMAAPEYLTLK